MEASTSTSHVSPSIGPLDPVADYCDDEASQLAISLDQIMNFNTKANIAEAEEQDKEKDKENEGSLPHRHLLPSAFSSSSSSQRNKQRNRRRRRRAGAGRRRRRRRKSNSSHGFNSTVCFQEAAKTALSATLGCRKALHRRITYRCNPYSSLSRRLLVSIGNLFFWFRSIFFFSLFHNPCFWQNDLLLNFSILHNTINDLSYSAHTMNDITCHLRFVFFVEAILLLLVRFCVGKVVLS